MILQERIKRHRPGPGHPVHDPRVHQRRRRDHRRPRPAHARDDQRLHDQPVRAAQAVHPHRHVARRRVPHRHRDLQHRARDRRLRRPAPVQLELRPGAVPGVRAGPRPGSRRSASPAAMVGLFTILGHRDRHARRQSRPAHRRLHPADDRARGHRTGDHAVAVLPARRGSPCAGSRRAKLVVDRR